MKSYIPELSSPTVFDAADLEAMQRIFEDACREMGLTPELTDERAVVARAIFAAYQGGERGRRELNASAWRARSTDIMRLETPISDMPSAARSV